MDIRRRAFLGGASALAASLATACAMPSGSSDRSSASPQADGTLVFDPNAFEEKTTTVSTDAGEKKVTYRFFAPITYVAKPVNADYQSLVISVPTSIEGKSVDATGAPIVFANSVGGYLPASVKDATEVGGSMSGGPMAGRMPSGSRGPGNGMPGPAGSSDEVNSGGNAMRGARGKMVNLAQLAVASGYVAVEPGCRGRTLVDGNGVYYGTAPAAIVDLKAAVRYLRANAGRVPGNTDRIVSTGTSAGGALSALLGASGDSSLYSRYLDEVGAADGSDAIFASGDWCPIADLEHADGAYEWNWGTNPMSDGRQVDQAVSGQMRDLFVGYQASLELKGRNGFGALTPQNYADYLLETYLQPSAARYLSALSDADREAYLEQNTFITWRGDRAQFTWQDFLTHVGARKKTLPAFDAFDLSTGENNLFGTGTTKARHFTDFSAAHTTTGDRNLDADIPGLRHLMNPMYFIAQQNPQRAKHWWIRLGTKDSDTSLTVSSNLAASLAALGDDVNHIMYWDEGHGANTDAADFVEWIGKVTA
ncbi:subtype B tannase [Gordonia sp. CPCC 206044]|uniref:subtype B tannase n=1 Tax=Gordonia sp. CPCC 206044 TaxID=3140793 RepID=UPI003AF3DB99